MLRLGASGLLAVLLFAAPVLLAAPEKVQVPETITAYDLSTGVEVVSDSKGTLLSFDRTNVLLASWKTNGKKDTFCSLSPLEELRNASTLGWNGGAAAIFSIGAKQLLIVDITSCKVTYRSTKLNDIIASITPSKNGWMAQTFDPGTRTTRYLEFDIQGRVLGEYQLSKDLADELPKSENPGAALGIPIAMGNEIWLLPRSKYVLIQPEQGVKAERKIDVPACLASTGQELSGEAAIAHFEESLKGAKGPTKAVLERMLTDAKAGKNLGLYNTAIAGASTFRGYLGVLVRPRKNCGTRYRFDIWDMSAEKIVSTVPVGDSCQGLLGFSDDGLFLGCGTEKNVRRLDLPAFFGAKPLADPCKAAGCENDSPQQKKNK